MWSSLSNWRFCSKSIFIEAKSPELSLKPEGQGRLPVLFFFGLMKITTVYELRDVDSPLERNSFKFFFYSLPHPHDLYRLECARSRVCSTGENSLITLARV